MSRTKFIYAYIGGVLAAFYGGAPWSYIFVLVPITAEAKETPAHFYLIALIAPILLVWAAHVRGQVIGRRGLSLFPIGAFFLSLVGVIWDRYVSGAPAALNRGTVTPAAMFFLFYGPALVHLICFSIGAKLRSSSTSGEDEVKSRDPRADFDSEEKGEPPVNAMTFANCVAIIPFALLFRLSADDGKTIIFCLVAVFFIVGFAAAGIAVAKGKYRNSAVAVTALAWPSFVVTFVAFNHILRSMGSKI